MKLLKLSCVMIGAALLALPAFAGTQAGQVELSASVAGTFGVSPSGNDTKLAFGALGVGYFVTDAVEIKLSADGLWMSAGGKDIYAFGLLAGPDYNFNIKDSKFVPYVGVYGGIYFAEVSGGSSYTEGALDGHVGCRYFVGEHTTINLQVSYQYIFVSEAGGQDIGNILASLGISYFF